MSTRVHSIVGDIRDFSESRRRLRSAVRRADPPGAQSVVRRGLAMTETCRDYSSNVMGDGHLFEAGGSWDGVCGGQRHQ